MSGEALDVRRIELEHPPRRADLAWGLRGDATERAYRMTLGEAAMLVVATLSWGTVIVLLAIFVRLRRLQALVGGSAHRRRPRPRATP